MIVMGGVHVHAGGSARQCPCARISLRGRDKTMARVRSNAHAMRDLTRSVRGVKKEERVWGVGGGVCGRTYARVCKGGRVPQSRGVFMRERWGGVSRVETNFNIFLPQKRILIHKDE